MLVTVVVILKARLSPSREKLGGGGAGKEFVLVSMTVVVPAVVPSGYVRATPVVTFDAMGVLGGGKVRLYGPRL